jgi:Zn-dependent peptidase ImmA (M78 family)
MTQRVQAKQLAQQLVSEYELTAPVPIVQLASDLGVAVKLKPAAEMLDLAVTKNNGFNKEDGILGIFDKKANSFLLNSYNQTLTRMRFTLAHELGHYFLHRDGEQPAHFRRVTTNKDITDQESEAEKAANYFAGYLLMPDSEIIKRLHLTEIMADGSSLIRNFAKFFAVSPESMRLRLRTFKEENEELWQKYQLDSKLATLIK